MPILTLGRRNLVGVPVGNLLMSAYGPNNTPASTVETDLASYQLPPNPLRIGEGLRLNAWFRTAANANTKRIRVYLGATTLFDSTALAANNEHIFMYLELLRTAAAGQTALTRGLRGTTVIAANVVTGTENMETPLLLRVTGTNGTAAAADLALHGATLQRVG